MAVKAKRNVAGSYCERYQRSPAAQLDGHEPVMHEFRGGTGFVFTCSCGAKISRPTGCNVAGFGYAFHYAIDAFDRHIAKVAGDK